MTLTTVSVATADFGYLEVVGEMFGDYLAITPEVGKVNGGDKPVFTGKMTIVHVPSGRSIQLPGPIRELATRLAEAPIDWSATALTLGEEEQAVLREIVAELTEPAAATITQVI
ncbi:hypothetical protein [Nocardia sp. NPDC059239]|uniref:hypothetical protein n=1 Tax=unclassified Nocardia TaxID=2637762 RepID=UPI003688AAA0